MMYSRFDIPFTCPQFACRGCLAVNEFLHQVSFRITSIRLPGQTSKGMSIRAEICVCALDFRVSRRLDPPFSISIMNESERCDELIGVATPGEVVSIPS